ncbi:hypothetical protein [Paenibacillus naphthalenovorans]|uniref:Uncharacterized protein n=1 Tax=Paenibacillus naphthalenovorans TaxID=162209 RepID=A0A0U2VNL5_9BACL|nr:hypothetical protein [Paenibacillus naphthalenovorans]ALS22326.1 hypothetical protein IJ22_19520 [Paenibacillus naphthalenovorans]
MNNLFLDSPVATNRFIWIATYADNTFLSEFSYDSKTENSFYSIDKSKLIRFGMVGYGMNMYYEVLGGIFKIAGQMIEVIYKDKTNNKEYYLTGQPMTMYNDIIQYKNAESNFDILGGDYSVTPSITQYNFGYKKTLNIDGVTFNFRAICSIPYGKPVFLNLRLVSSQEFSNGCLLIKKNGIVVSEYDANAEENVAYELNWQVTV